MESSSDEMVSASTPSVLSSEDGYFSCDGKLDMSHYSELSMSEYFKHDNQNIRTM